MNAILVKLLLFNEICHVVINIIKSDTLCAFEVFVSNVFGRIQAWLLILDSFRNV